MTTMTDAFDLGPAPRRVPVDAEQVARLVAAQFPRWAGLPVRPVPEQGWDNQTFRLGPEMSVRLPSAAEYALAVEKERHWLPVLARRLPLPVPVPLANGEPGAGYPFRWSVLRWLDGVTATRAGIADEVRFARDLAGFLRALRRVDPSGGPRPGRHNWFRGGPLSTYTELLDTALTVPDHRSGAVAGSAGAGETRPGPIDAGLIREIWRTALDVRWDGVDRWFHGDVAPGNLLVSGGELAAVIDFGTCGVGDPACDLAIAWTLLSGAGREAFRAELAVDDATWARGQGWALWKTAVCVADAAGDPAADAHRVLREIVSDFRS
jgi:aminoglycoside phosphotransferase (APT) family kinase protein